MPLAAVVRRFIRDKRGNIAVIFSLALLPLVGATGSAVDYSRASFERSRLQAAIDAAVLRGAETEAATQNAAATKAFADIYGSATPVPAFTANADGSFTGTARASVQTQFMRAFGKTSIPVTVTATAVAGDAPQGAVCVLLLEPSAQGLTLNSGASINAPNCEIDVKSTANPAAMFNSGSTFNFEKVCVQGANVTQNSITIPNLQTKCQTASDPFAGTLPTPSTAGGCTSTNYNGGTVSLAPGIYCAINFNSTTNVNFAPGLYVIRNGTWNVNGGVWACPTCTGDSGVTFYFADANSKFQFNSGVKATLKAPATGPYAGILFFEAPNLSKSSFTFNPSAGFDWTGLVYLPSRNVTFNSSSQVSSGNITLVFNTLMLNGTKWSFDKGAKTISPGSGGSGQASSSARLKF
ncbi:TadE/TadG family type IV pilus assembly protein [Enterovirga sp. CN4-39]|uniref:TadE/TadG family type IV pilus assembly protein n=1 Tax=Enterovirga sp. CN4-39 TaxID=3400910 RepID=UPI003C0BC798